jgi:hypothetical protein
VVYFAVAVAPFSVIYQAVNISFRRDSGIRLPGVGTDGRTLLYLFGDQREKSELIDIFDDFSPKPGCSCRESRRLVASRSPASFGSSIPENLSFILPGSSKVGFDRPLPCRRRCPEYLLPEPCEFLKVPVMTRFLSKSVCSTIEFELCSIRNGWMISRHSCS